MLLKELEMEDCGRSELLPYTGKTTTILDMMAFVQSSTKAGKKNFGELADSLARTVLHSFAYSNNVHVVPDRYNLEDSIKSGERCRRTLYKSLEVKIKGRETKLPSNMKKFLMNKKNKSNLIAFLISDWCKTMQNKLTEHQSVVLADEEGYAVIVTQTGTSNIPELYSDHEEADSRMFAHAKYAVDNQEAGRIVITSPDTDVAVLCIYHFSELDPAELWFATGVGNKRRFVAVHEIAVNLGEILCNLLPAFHSLTGCDSTSSLFGHSKKSALKSLRLSNESFERLHDLGNNACSSEICPDTIAMAMTFICQLYESAESTDDTDLLRYKLCVKKGLENARLPPTKDSALLHVFRANYQCYVWKHACSPMLHLPSPENNGWIRSPSGELVPELMKNPSAPESLPDLAICKCTKGCANNICKCRRSGLPCIDSCSCGDNCQNVRADDCDIEDY